MKRFNTLMAVCIVAALSTVEASTFCQESYDLYIAYAKTQADRDACRQRLEACVNGGIWIEMCTGPDDNCVPDWYRCKAIAKRAKMPQNYALCDAEKNRCLNDNSCLGRAAKCNGNSQEANYACQ